MIGKLKKLLSILIGCLLITVYLLHILQPKPYPQHMYFVNYTDNNEIFVNNINSTRINRLLKILLEKEARYYEILNDLKLPLFSKLIDEHNDYYYYKQYKYEIDNYLQSSKDNLCANDKFVQYLYNLSFYYSFNESSDYSSDNSTLFFYNNVSIMFLSNRY